MAPLNVLFCSTFENTRDACRQEAVRYLLQRALRPRPLACRVDVPLGRNPSQELARGHKFDVLKESEDGGDFPLIVATGAVDLKSKRLDTRAGQYATSCWLFIGIDLPPDIDIQIDSKAFLVLSKALVICRERTGSEALERVGIKSQILPCPALFACEWEAPSRQLGMIAVVVDESVSTEDNKLASVIHSTSELIQQLRRCYNVVLVRGNLDAFSKSCRGVLMQCDAVVVNDVSVALLANSFLKPAILPMFNREPPVVLPSGFSPFIYSVQQSHIVRFLGAMNIESVGRAMLNWKRLVEAEYIRVLQSQLSRYGFDPL
jgi:hypothetical protein